MGERFVVVPVDTGAEVAADAVIADPAADTGGSGDGTAAAKEAEEDPVSEPQDHDAVVPILEYNREPNKYGRTAAGYEPRVPFVVISVL